eukprot:scaffold18149_cov129-Isochrysis_galbana.AAC.3
MRSALGARFVQAHRPIPVSLVVQAHRLTVSTCTASQVAANTCGCGAGYRCTSNPCSRSPSASRALLSPRAASGRSGANSPSVLYETTDEGGSVNDRSEATEREVL